MRRRRRQRRDGGLGRVALRRHHLGAARRVPRAHQLGVGQVLREPEPALSQRHRVRVDPPDVLQPGARHRHDRVMHREQHLVRQVQRAVAEGLVQQVVGGGDRADQRVLDREAAGIGSSLADRRHHVRDLAAGNGSSSGHRRRAAASLKAPWVPWIATRMGSCSCVCHSCRAQKENAPPAGAGGASRVRSVALLHATGTGRSSSRAGAGKKEVPRPCIHARESRHAAAGCQERLSGIHRDRPLADPGGHPLHVREGRVCCRVPHDSWIWPPANRNCSMLLRSISLALGSRTLRP